jgi:hypothetical protein
MISFGRILAGNCHEMMDARGRKDLKSAEIAQEFPTTSQEVHG